MRITPETIIHFIKRHIPIILAMILLSPFVAKGFILVENWIQAKWDEEKLCGAVSGHFSLVKYDPERITFLAEQGRGYCDSLFTDEEYHRLIETPEACFAFEVELYLENRSDVDLHMLEIYSADSGAYVDNGYLICDKPLLLGNTGDKSHDRTWILMENNGVPLPETLDRLKRLRLTVEGSTQHGYTLQTSIQYQQD